jgi:hypothetical protein
LIVSLLATLVLQAQPAPDAAAATVDISRQCLAVMTDEAEPRAGSSLVPLDGGLEALVVITTNGCSLEIDGWREDSGAFTTRVRDGLLADVRDWEVAQWRERKVNESGPTRWTSLVIPDVRRHSAFWIQIIEPEEGAPSRLSVSFGIGP